MMTRRQLGLLGFAHIALAFVLSCSLVLSGCTASDEAMAILDGTLPVVQGIGAVVALADPALGPAVTSAITLYSGAVTVAEKAYADWKVADATAQPGALGAFEAAMATVKTDLNSILTAAKVTNTQNQNSIDLLFSAALSAVTEVITLTEQVKAAGGTTAAMELVLHEQWGGGKDPAPATKAKTAKLPSPAIDHKHMAADLKKRLAVKTGDSRLDAVRAQIAASVK